MTTWINEAGGNWLPPTPEEIARVNAIREEKARNVIVVSGDPPKCYLNGSLGGDSRAAPVTMTDLISSI